MKTAHSSLIPRPFRRGWSKSFGNTGTCGKDRAGLARQPRVNSYGPRHPSSYLLAPNGFAWLASLTSYSHLPCFAPPTSVWGCPIFCSGRDKMYKWWVVDKVYSSAAGSSSIIFYMSTDNWCQRCRRSSFRWEEGRIKSAVRSQAVDLYLTFFLI